MDFSKLKLVKNRAKVTDFVNCVLYFRRGVTDTILILNFNIFTFFSKEIDKMNILTISKP